ncbi:hypothetical protein ACNHYB_15695 [Isoptericola jiangsuensis]|uniref:hypothetical protein n=1 Tax=Isoptericola jiangsuensis TaxID=548579 RepID=UPI003AACA304
MPSSRPSRKRPWGAEHTPLDLDRARGGVRNVSAADGEWTVRTVRGGDKAYTCPVCHQQIPPGAAHVVAWENDGRGSEAGVENRRHWHSSCFERRQRLR